MGLRDKVTLLLIWVIFYQMAISECLPRRYKPNCGNKSRNILHKSQCPMARTPTTKTFNKAQKSTASELGWKASEVSASDKTVDRKNLCLKAPPQVKDNWEIPQIPDTPDFEQNLDLSTLYLKLPSGVRSNWDIPEVPNFENSFDLSKLSIPEKNYRPANSPLCNPFNPCPTPYCFKEKGSFPDVEYPLDVNELRIPNYWNDFIEKKLNQQGKEIDEVCQGLYEGKSKPQPRAKNEVIEKAINALIKSQLNNKESLTKNTPITLLTEPKGSLGYDTVQPKKTISESDSNNERKDESNSKTIPTLEGTETPKSETDSNRSDLLSELIVSVVPSQVAASPLEALSSLPDKYDSGSTTIPIINEKVPPEVSEPITDVPVSEDGNTPTEKSKSNKQLISSLIFPLGDIGSVTTLIERPSGIEELSTNSIPLVPLGSPVQPGTGDLTSVVDDTLPIIDNKLPSPIESLIADIPLDTSLLAAAPLAEDPLAAAPLAATPLATTLLAATPLAETPGVETLLAAAPLAEDLLATAPLAETPLATTLLAATTLAETPGVETLLAAAPLALTPLAETPGVETLLTAAPLVAAPLTAAPIAAAPLTATPLAAAPLTADPLAAAPLAAAPLAATPLSETPGVETLLAATPLAELPLEDTDPTLTQSTSDNIVPITPVSDILTDILASLVAAGAPVDEDFEFVTMPPSMEETLRVVRSCPEKDPLVFLSPGDVEYIIV